MNRRILVVEEAEAELVAAVRWYDAHRPGLGAELQASVDEALARLVERVVAASPVSGMPAAIGAMKVFVARFPYAVIFVERGDDIWVLAFAHHHRRPGYWRGRDPSAPAGG